MRVTASCDYGPVVARRRPRSSGYLKLYTVSINSKLLSLFFFLSPHLFVTFLLTRLPLSLHLPSKAFCSPSVSPLLTAPFSFPFRRPGGKDRGERAREENAERGRGDEKGE